MRQRVTPVFSRLCCTFAVAAAIVAQATVASSQGLTFVKPNLPVAAPVATPAAGMPNAEANSAISRVLDSGRTLEMGGHWADALTKYEEALHEYPEDHALQARFDVARLHYSLEQRYDDRSFREALKTLQAAANAGTLYRSLGQDRRSLLYRSAVPGDDAARRGGDGYRFGRRELPAEPRHSRSRPTD